MAASMSLRLSALLLFTGLALHTYANPQPTPRPVNVAPRTPIITPSVIPQYPTKASRYRRDLVSDLDGDVHSVLSGLGSDVPSFVASGIPQFFENLPTGTAVQSSLSISDDELASYPTAVLNFAPYANWTDQGWNVRFHGNIYRQPNISLDKLDDLADAFLIDASISDLPASQAAQARNVTSEIFIIQDAHAPAPLFSLAPAPSAGASGEQGGGGAVIANGGRQTVQFPFNATAEGDFDAFVPIKSNGLTAGNATNNIQRLNVYTNGSTNGNTTAYLVPPEGITVVSDIDDILRITKIWDPKEIISNTFAKPYFIYATYPAGSFDTRPLNFSNVPETLSVRKYLLDKLFQTFPRRKFILVGDVSNSDIMKDYPKMVTEYPGQVQCIFLRNTTATDSTDEFPYDTSGFKGIKQQQFMFFVVPDDLKNLDIANGNCWNSSVPQNLTFGYQNLPLGLGSGAQSSAGNKKSAAPASIGVSSSIKALYAFIAAVFVASVL
ncbi:MAG: hypothetical protein M1828_006838 [Chrysothrix sp. TS-e1954]|nr:MAG: hypothetical protein M1828_006838 [Chrysothrix sp. TS-e1954]